MYRLFEVFEGRTLLLCSYGKKHILVVLLRSVTHLQMATSKHYAAAAAVGEAWVAL